MLPGDDVLNSSRAHLVARRDELRSRLIRIGVHQRRESEPLSIDAPDRSIQRANDDVVDSLGVAANAELLEIEAALARMDEGRYGICEGCGFLIEPKRLAAVPHARCCLGCAGERPVHCAAI